MRCATNRYMVFSSKWYMMVIGYCPPLRLVLQVSRIHVDSINAPSILPGIDLSDHRNYRKFGYDAVMVTDSAFYRNPHYHEPTDTIDTLYSDYMAEV
ncbi:MAG: hypothetical protein A4E64_01083 [Syntrophorhabdus sp. PtaU1.Bin058]|nr:MAG: hypothetical protein A4E64_01083 [Syntrophorhabdus sp. PtaU1.Bin058]